MKIGISSHALLHVVAPMLLAIAPRRVPAIAAHALFLCAIVGIAGCSPNTRSKPEATRSKPEVIATLEQESDSMYGKRPVCDSILKMAREHDADLTSLSTLDRGFFTIELQRILADAQGRRFLIIASVTDISRQGDQHEIIVIDHASNIYYHLACTPEIAEEAMAVPRKAYPEFAFVVSVESIQKPNLEVIDNDEGTLTVVSARGTCHDIRQLDGQFIEIQDVLAREHLLGDGDSAKLDRKTPPSSG